ncbi:MAG: hypothetical protein HGB22_03830 [Chlorobiaceae bacterium]|nr:hypothetical protein [Chlorobiaceae bacterium]
MYTIENAGSYIRVVFSGRVNDDDLLNAFKDEVALPDYREKNALWVFDGCECDFSHSCYEELTRYISTYYPRNATRLKTAILTSNNLHQALAELFLGQAEELTYSIRIFQEQSEADAWLRQ